MDMQIDKFLVEPIFRLGENSDIYNNLEKDIKTLLSGLTYAAYEIQTIQNPGAKMYKFPMISDFER